MKRFKALDVFRGLTVCLMIIVNTPGDWSSTFSPLLHAKWHGFTPTDLVFPSFLFAVGNAFAFVKTKWGDKTFSDVFKKNSEACLDYIFTRVHHVLDTLLILDGSWRTYTYSL
ncbi:hypothetical protein ACU8V7_14135 [Zobellia nedashkovskayae]